jgi:regulator of replication initiation timing
VDLIYQEFLVNSGEPLPAPVARELLQEIRRLQAELADAGRQQESLHLELTSLREELVQKTDLCQGLESQNRTLQRLSKASADSLEQIRKILAAPGPQRPRTF